MNICLIGTSNSIYKDGYAGGLEQSPYISHVVRNSIGASPSIIIPYFASQIDFSQFDWLILETAINDRNYYKYGSITKKQIREFIEYGIARALEKGCLPFLLIMPSRKAFDKETISGLIYRKIANELNIPVLNGFEYIQQYAKQNNMTIGDCFIDDFHIQKPIAYEIGLKIAEILNEKRDIQPLAPVYKYHYKVIDLAFYSSKTIHRKTSILQYEFACLESNDQISIPIKPSTSIVGIAYNAAKTVGSLYINSDQPVVKDLTTKYLLQDKELLLFMVPVTGDCLVHQSDQLFISLAATEQVETESSRFESFSFPETAQKRLEIQALIIRKPI